MCLLHIYNTTHTSEPMATHTPDLTDERAPLDDGATLAALEQLFDPLARLCIGKGITIQAVEERLRQSFVRAARNTCERAHPDHPRGRLTSRISTMTGLTRREVTRLETREPPRRGGSRSHASDLFARWLADPACRAGDGSLRSLRRQGTHPSFESLAATVTRDVHPRTLLDEMIRQQLVSLDAATDRVALRSDAFVPRGQHAQMLAFLGDNVGDHLEGAVTNVLGSDNEHFEQALFADELSTQSVDEARRLIGHQWQHLMTTIAPALQALMDADKAAGRAQDQCLRLGLYSWTQPMQEQPLPRNADDHKER